MRLVPVKIPSFIKRIFPNYVWDFSSHSKVIYLTFDDGPNPEITPWVLDVLKRYNAKATFFCIGDNVEKHPAVFKRVLNDGHAIGNHTYNHLRGWNTGTKNYIENTLKAQSAIDAITPHTAQPPLFRPPYGQITPRQSKALRALGYKIIMWSVITFDWEDYLSPEQCLNNALKNTADGNIIVFHDSIKASKNMMYALPEVLKHFSGLGYTFKAISFSKPTT
ncbi:polysaccharide deacetylase family protein [Bizionia gelidisalsuginis]|uniref:Polysaccharide deacetylase family protein n=1 Tax=Bizionia gelidisalsuginis TaxID=291188 RepID=A0ABY3M8Z5_9FLAO|nr:polysaccharide deacetylase family protein [Bizionia gelidisalsuginis]TYC10726.1 polysaccharide deacetylase family protein [Bizionia gelidisalsuginis]